MSDWSVRKVITVGVLATVAIWVFALLPAFLIKAAVPAGSIPVLGASGDMFGAASALFNGLGFFAVVLVLYFDLRERREDLRNRGDEVKERKHARTPFLVASVVDEGVRLVRATNAKGSFPEAKLVLDLEVENVSPEPAMNIILSSVGCDEEALTAHADLDDTPFGVGMSAKREAKAQFSPTGPAADALLRRLAEGKPTVVELSLEYDSINSTRWTSSVKYELRTKDAEGRDVFRRVLDGDPAAFIDEGEGFSAPAYLDFKIVPRSWEHEVVTPPQQPT